MSLLSIGSALVGGLLGAKSSKGGKQTTTQRMDPRMEQAVYGGLLPAAQEWFSRNQMGNQLMQHGAQLQADFYQDPLYRQGFDQLRRTGLGLLGAGVAGNPHAPNGGQWQQQWMAPQMLWAQTRPMPAPPPAPREQAVQPVMPSPQQQLTQQQLARQQWLEKQKYGDAGTYYDPSYGIGGA